MKKHKTVGHLTKQVIETFDLNLKSFEQLFIKIYSMN